jgi:hypothetical protein
MTSDRFIGVSAQYNAVRPDWLGQFLLNGEIVRLVSEAEVNPAGPDGGSTRFWPIRRAGFCCRAGPDGERRSRYLSIGMTLAERNHVHRRLLRVLQFQKIFNLEIGIALKLSPILVACDQRYLFDWKSCLEQTARSLVPQIVEVQVFDLADFG